MSHYEPIPTGGPRRLLCLFGWHKPRTMHTGGANQPYMVTYCKVCGHVIEVRELRA